MKIIKLEKKNCNPCRMVSNLLDNAGVEYEHIDVFENPDIASQYGVMSTPVTILLDDDSSEIQRSIGYKPEELQEMLGIL